VFIYIAREEQNTREGEAREGGGCPQATILSAYMLHNPVLATGIYHAHPQLRQL